MKQRENKSKEISSKKLADSLFKDLVVSYCAQSEEIIDLANPLEVPAPAESEKQIIENSPVTEDNNLIEAAPVVDPLGVLTAESPIERKRSVSTEINRFECGRASVLSPERAGFISIEPLDDLSPQSLNNELGRPLSAIEEEVFVNKMEEATYKAKLKQAKLYRRQFNSLLSTFTVEDVIFAVHKEIYKEKLNTIGVKYTEISDWLDSLIIDLDENDEAQRITEVEAIQTEIRALKRNHEKSILEKISQLLTGSAEGVGPATLPLVRPPDSVVGNRDESKKLEELKAKAGIKKSFIEDKVKALTQKVKAFKAPVEMSNDEVRYAMKESKI